MKEAPLEIAFQEPRLAGVEESASREERFAALARRQARFVFRVAYSVLRDIHDAEDVVQETSLKLYKNGSWEGIADERAFLARAAWRMALDRRPKAHAELTEIDLPAKERNPEQAAIAADWNATVHRLMDTLPEEFRMPLALSTVEEMSSREIAEVMGIPEGTVRTRLMRARGILREKLEAMGVGRDG